MLDLNSISQISEPSVYLIHAIVNARYFWAFWSNIASFQAGCLPEEYRVTAMKPEQIICRLRIKNAHIKELELPDRVKRDIYRSVKREELPEAVQEKIKLTLKLRHNTWQKPLLDAGFSLEDLKDLKSLKRRYRQLLYQHHPDHGGQDDAFLNLHGLYQEAYVYLSV